MRLHPNLTDYVRNKNYINIILYPGIILIILHLTDFNKIIYLLRCTLNKKNFNDQLSIWEL